MLARRKNIKINKTDSQMLHIDGDLHGCISLAFGADRVYCMKCNKKRIAGPGSGWSKQNVM